MVATFIHRPIPSIYSVYCLVLLYTMLFFSPFWMDWLRMQYRVYMACSVCCSAYYNFLVYFYTWCILLRYSYHVPLRSSVTSAFCAFRTFCTYVLFIRRTTLDNRKVTVTGVSGAFFVWPPGSRALRSCRGFNAAADAAVAHMFDAVSADVPSAACRTLHTPHHHRTTPHTTCVVAPLFHIDRALRTNTFSLPHLVSAAFRYTLPRLSNLSRVGSLPSRIVGSVGSPFACRLFCMPLLFSNISMPSRGLRLPAPCRRVRTAGGRMIIAMPTASHLVTASIGIHRQQEWALFAVRWRQTERRRWWRGIPAAAARRGNARWARTCGTAALHGRRCDAGWRLRGILLHAAWTTL